MKLYCVQCVTLPHSTNSVHITGTILHRWCFTAGYCKPLEVTYNLLSSHFATTIGGACNATKNINIKISTFNFQIMMCKLNFYSKFQVVPRNRLDTHHFRHVRQKPYCAGLTF